MTLFHASPHIRMGCSIHFSLGINVENVSGTRPATSLWTETIGSSIESSNDEIAKFLVRPILGLRIILRKHS